MAARVVLDAGEVVDCDADNEAQLFEVAHLSLGAVGVVMEVRISVRDAYKLADRSGSEPLDEVLYCIDDLALATRVPQIQGSRLASRLRRR